MIESPLGSFDFTIKSLPVSPFKQLFSMETASEFLNVIYSFKPAVLILL